jgi:catechol 2,3-dioxygenase
MKENLAPAPIDAGVRIGHVHLKVADLERALKFYCGVLGFELQQKFGTQAAFISAGGYHHHIGLNTWESAGGLPPPPRSTAEKYIPDPRGAESRRQPPRQASAFE